MRREGPLRAEEAICGHRRSFVGKGGPPVAIGGISVRTLGLRRYRKPPYVKEIPL